MSDPRELVADYALSAIKRKQAEKEGKQPKRYKVIWKAPSILQPHKDLEAEHDFDEEDAKTFAWSMLRQGLTVRAEEAQS